VEDSHAPMLRPDTARLATIDDQELGGTGISRKKVRRAKPRRFTDSLRQEMPPRST
jgi:hypothetical protein